VKFIRDPTKALLKARLDLEESLEQNLLGLTSASGGSFDEFVHETRRCLQRCRAILRCYHGAIKQKEISRLERVFASAARSLAPIRDLGAMIGGLDFIKAFFREEFESAELRDILERLRQKLLAQYHAEVERFAAQHAAARLLRNLVSTFKNVDTAVDSIELSEDELERVVENARDAIKRSEKLAHKEQTPSALHELRKKVKRLRYILEYLPLKGVSKERKKLKQRSEVLGQWRDVYLLGTAIERLVNDGESDFQILQRYVMRLLSELQRS